MGKVSSIRTQTQTLAAAADRVAAYAPWLRAAVTACRFSVTGNPYTRVTATGRVELARGCGRSVPVAAEHITAAVMAVLREYPGRLIEAFPPAAANAAASAVTLYTAAEAGLGGYVAFEPPHALAQRVFAPDESAEELARGLVIDLLRTNRHAPDAPIRLAVDPDDGDDEREQAGGSARGGDRREPEGAAGEPEKQQQQEQEPEGAAGEPEQEQEPEGAAGEPEKQQQQEQAPGPAAGYDVADEPGPLTADHLDALRHTVAHAMLHGDVGRGQPPVETQRWAARVTGQRSPADTLRGHLTGAVDRSSRGTRASWSRTALFVDESADPSLLQPGMVRPYSTVGLVVDVSGSMRDEEIAEAVSVLSDVAATRAIDARYVCVSDRVLGPARPVEPGRDITIDRDKAGTDMRAGVEWLVSSGHRCGMVVTDGKTPWPATPVPGLELVACLVGRGAAGRVAEVPGWIRTVVLSSR